MSTSPSEPIHHDKPIVPAWAMTALALAAAGIFAFAIQRSWTETSHPSSFYAGVRSTLGILHSQQGRLETAASEFHAAMQLDPSHAEACNNLGNIQMQQGQLDEAIASYRKALTLRPKYADAQNNLGLVFLHQGRLEEAIGHFHVALELRHDFADAHNNFGYALLQKGRHAEALAHFQEAIKVNPQIAQVHHNGALAYFHLGRVADAVDSYRRAIKLNPGQLGSLNNLAWLLATLPDDSLRSGIEAVTLAETAVQMTSGADPMILHTLAAAYAEVGRFNEASTVARRALELALAAGNQTLADALRDQMQFYADAKPYREAPEVSAPAPK